MFALESIAKSTDVFGYSSSSLYDLLARPMYLYGSIEQIGYETEMMVEKCTEQGLRIPDFEQDTNFSVTFWRNEENKNSEEALEEKVSDVVGEKGTEKIGGTRGYWKVKFSHHANLRS
jgi:predicted HTH transcriptional regulator